MTHPLFDGYEKLNLYFGDIHNHCGLSYGHGSLEEALANARLQLDFTSVTIHAVWPDLPADDPQLAYLVNYHKKGFAHARRNWPAYLAAMEAANDEGRFVTFPSFEWHSNQYGDHCVYYNPSPSASPASVAELPIIDARNLPELRQRVRETGVPSLVIPHHIGYRQGYRGINWETFDNELSPLVEVFSFHGLSESSRGPYPYLHSMGPRHGPSTAQHAWADGKVFGIIGSTDHHNAFPGSYGYGRMGVWATSLTRDAIWEAIAKRRTYALTGDRIALGFRVNESLMGDIGPGARERWIEAEVIGGDVIDYVEVLHNNQVIYRSYPFSEIVRQGRFKVHLEAGWGERKTEMSWKVTVSVHGGKLLDVEPRFQGYGPTDEPGDTQYAYTGIQRQGENQVSFTTRTRANPSLHTSATEGLALEIQGDEATTFTAVANGETYQVALGELLHGARAFYTGGFVSPALCFHQAAPEAAYRQRLTFSHVSDGRDRDWYYMRVRQANNQWAWSSPIWIAGESA
ncbi:MAG: DUF3604 domain-containing protein [Caldilineaceae bacterium]|nr:DUF3604 domain-containing protein [Caldilineaceae bacterium]